jgi:acetate kinase
LNIGFQAMQFQFARLLKKQSGLLGVSGRSGDTRELIMHESEKRVGLALDMFASSAPRDSPI